LRQATPFSIVHATDQFRAAAQALDAKRQKQAEKAVSLLFDNPAHPGLNGHAIKPDKHFWEAYLNRSDRLIYVPDYPVLVLVDIVKHDDIGRYGKAP
jgi:hypothetical protein